MAVGGVLNFDIQKDAVELHKIFQQMEEAKSSLGNFFPYFILLY